MYAGLLAQAWSWESIFVGFAASGALLLIAACTLPESRQSERHRFDWMGSLSVIPAIGLFVIALTEGPARGWTDGVVVGLFAGAVVLTLVFTRAELRSEHPLLQLRFLLDRKFGSGALSLIMLFVALFGGIFLLVQFLELILHYGQLKAALAIVPTTIPIAVVSAIIPWLAPRVGLRVITVSGFLSLAVGFGLYSRLNVGAHYLDVLWPWLIIGTAIGLCMAPATAAIMDAVPQDVHGVAAAVNDVTRELGAAIGIAVGGSVLAAGYGHQIQPALAQLPAQARKPVSDSLAAALEMAPHLGPTAQHVAESARVAFVYGHNQAALVLAIIAVVGAIILSLWAPEREPAPADTAEPFPTGDTPNPTTSRWKRG